jgi:hypothetical protein
MPSDDEDLLSELHSIKEPPSNADSLSTPDAELWGRDFINEYQEVGDRHSFENKHLHVGLGLSLVSQAVGNAYFLTGDSEQSTRVHPLIIQGSGTGKDPAFNFAKLVADEAGLKMRDVNDVTNAGLIGTVQQGDPEPGLAKTADVIGFREATSLFRTTKQEHSANLAENLNQVLDGQEVSRNLAGGKLEYQPDCTLVGTTYPPTDLDLEELMTNGLLARFLYFFKAVGDDFRWRMGERAVEETISPTDEDDSVERLNQLAGTISGINQTFDPEQRFWFQPSIQDVDVTTRLQNLYDEYDAATREIVAPAITRYNIHFLRVACLMAALDECSTVVTKQHGELAWQIIEESWRNLLEFYERNVSTAEQETNLRGSETAILRVVFEQPGISQSDLAERIGFSKRSVRERTTALEAEGLLESDASGRERIYRPPAADD